MKKLFSIITLLFIMVLTSSRVSFAEQSVGSDIAVCKKNAAEEVQYVGTSIQVSVNIEGQSLVTVTKGEDQGKKDITFHNLLGKEKEFSALREVILLYPRSAYFWEVVNGEEVLMIAFPLSGIEALKSGPACVIAFRFRVMGGKWK